MSELIPGPPTPFVPEPEHAARQIDALTREERLRRWEVRAAQWRACELAVETFGEGVEASLVSLRTTGPLRGLLRLDVPFDSLPDHRTREAAFLASVGSDALLSQVPLVYVLGPGPA
jgi:hypothetical protein